MANLTFNHSDKTDQYIADLLSYVDHDVATSQDCLKSGIDTKTSAYFRKFLTDPINAYLENHKNNRENILNSVHLIMDFFLKKNSQLIDKAYYNPANKTTYYISLKEDNHQTREYFFEFLEIFDELNISNSFEILINFLPKGAEKSINKALEIHLS